MARTLKLLHQLIDPSDDTILFGSNTRRNDVPIPGDEIYRTTVTVADDYAVENLWTTGDGGVESFKLALILTNQNILVEMRNDDGTPKFIESRVVANCPCYLGDASAGGTSSIFTDGTETTAEGAIDRIEAQRNVANGQGDATVTLVLFN